MLLLQAVSYTHLDVYKRQGYLIGIASGIAILVGVLIAWAGFVPYFTNIFAPDGGATAKFAMAVWKSKVRFIGAGAIGIAAIWTLITLIKPIIEGMKISVKSMNSSSAERELHRMDTDMSTKSVLGAVSYTHLDVYKRQQYGR